MVVMVMVVAVTVTSGRAAVVTIVSSVQNGTDDRLDNWLGAPLFHIYDTLRVLNHFFDLLLRQGDWISEVGGVKGTEWLVGIVVGENDRGMRMGVRNSGLVGLALLHADLSGLGLLLLLDDGLKGHESAVEGQSRGQDLLVRGVVVAVGDVRVGVGDAGVVGGGCGGGGGQSGCGDERFHDFEIFRQ